MKGRILRKIDCSTLATIEDVLVRGLQRWKHDTAMGAFGTNENIQWKMSYPGKVKHFLDNFLVFGKV